MAHKLIKIKPRAKRTENLSAQVYSQIKNLILCNEILPGQKLHHQELSERLGVSRTPVREALTRLVQEGYVSLLPNRGFTCKEIRLQEANELYELREALEAFIVEKAIANLLSLLKIGQHVVFARLNMRATDFHGVLSVASLHRLVEF